MVIKTLIMPTLGTNCYLIADEAAKVCAVIDPGDPDPRILAAIEAEGWTLACFLLTHAHYDHTMGLPELRRALPDVPVYVHPGDKEMPKPFFRIAEIGPLTFYEEGDRVELGEITLQVMHTPGHSQGSVVLRAGDVLFTGDTLFKGSMGRTDLPGGSDEEMRRSLRRLGALEGDLKVLPGHSEATTLDHERKYNYLLKEAMKGG
ncbi:MBL fold metallo-hydrolase [Pseudoflavonifractor sp. 524-17]|uniref:MBL fold metallo-hydrolase n=1 Tax=Pseudoflavonifractor sp. 524-17 TaxID=2304577 RepID=UPI00137B2FF5|nr:MBL fold metallo-hydrolase [Pseudoflavonifractor sp. 524-17]NCE63621.1 MBL fold metallo-hydrolase [Pseudoflavonifractor sp. 524-17]